LRSSTRAVYSLNPGRYIGVVIEEDGKTEDDFIRMIVLP
jgi:type I restriction enzyme M protein